VSVDHVLQLNEFFSASKETQKYEAKSREDYMMDVFDPVKDFTVASVFYLVPRWCQVNDDDLIQSDAFVAFNTTRLPFCRADTKEALDADRIDACVVDERPKSIPETASSFQKKIVPWESMAMDLDIDYYRLGATSNRQRSDLIVVASLVDRFVVLSAK
jgi:hypothetical protein